jgi:lysophospholipase L1-like esterase
MWLFRLLAIGFGLTVTLLVCELVLRLLGLGYGHSPQVGHAKFHHWNPSSYQQLVWGPRDQFGGFQMYFNSDGMGMKEEIPPATTPTLVFLGDSFTLARQVPEEKNFATLSAQRLGEPLVNLGNGSACPILSALELDFFAEKINPIAVVYQIYANDIDGEQAMRKLAVRDEQGKITAVPGVETPLSVRLARRSYVARLVRSMYMAWQFNRQHEARTANAGAKVGAWSCLHPKPLTEMYTAEELANFTESILRVHEFCQQRGCPLFIMVIPDRGALEERQPDFLAQYIQDLAAANGIGFIDLLSRFQGEQPRALFFEDDIHLTQRGHELATDAIVATLEPVVEQWRAATAAAPANSETDNQPQPATAATEPVGEPAK